MASLAESGAMTASTPAASTDAIASIRSGPESRSRYCVFRTISTRWLDNDAYGHVNNAVHYSWFDSAVNAYLIEHGALDIGSGETIGLVVESGCNYFSPIAFPQLVDAGLRVAHMGNTSVRYEIGLFVKDGALTAAKGHFIHVYVDRASRRPVPLSSVLKSALKGLQ